MSEIIPLEDVRILDKKDITRERWFRLAVEKVRPIFKKAGQDIPDNYMISCGWPSREIKKTIGQCFDPEMTENGTCHMFVSPLLDDPIRVLDVLMHEVCHHVVGVKEKHRAPFIKLARAIGLEGKPTATYAGEELKAKLEAIIEDLGPYPHPAIKLPGKDIAKPPAKRLKLLSPVDPEYNVWISPTFLEKHGPPLCPICEEPMIIEKPERMEERKARGNNK